MAQSATPNGTALPEPSPGITCLQVTEPKSPAIYELVTDWLTAERPSFWVDSRNVANTYRLYEWVAADRALSGLQIARAFTAYQHYTLCQRLLQSVTPRTELVCLPNPTSLYRDDDVPEHERTTLLDAVCGGLADLADTYGLPIVVSTTHDDALTEPLLHHAERTIRCEQTPFGIRYDGEDVDTTVYRDGPFWQTTIPYWVDLYGSVEETSIIDTAAATGFAGVV